MTICPSEDALGAPSTEARAAVVDLRLEMIGETADRAARYARRAASAARRRDLIGVHVRLLRAGRADANLIAHSDATWPQRARTPDLFG